jgi:hypothetical protein
VWRRRARRSAKHPPLDSPSFVTARTYTHLPGVSAAFPVDIRQQCSLPTGARLLGHTACKQRPNRPSLPGAVAVTQDRARAPLRFQASSWTPSSHTACGRVTQGSQATIHVHAPQDVHQAAPDATARPTSPTGLPLLKLSMLNELLG